MRIKLKRFKYLSINNWRISLINLLCISLVVTIFLTAYLHGLIELDTNRLVINIAPASITKNNHAQPQNQQINNKNNDRQQSPESLLNENNENYLSDIKRINQNDPYNINENRKIFINVETVKRHYLGTEPKVTSIDKNITNLFLVIERNRPIIVSTLGEREIDELFRLKSAMFIAANLNDKNERQASEIHKPGGDLDKVAEDLENDPAAILAAVNNNINNNFPAHQLNKPINSFNNPTFNLMNDTRAYELNANDIQFGSIRPITRELMIKFLKLEKFKLQKVKEIKTVQNLLDEFIAQNDLNRE